MSARQRKKDFHLTNWRENLSSSFVCTSTFLYNEFSEKNEFNQTLEICDFFQVYQLGF